MKLKRYDIGREHVEGIGMVGITEQADGKYMLAADHDRLMAACEAHNEMLVGRLKLAEGAQPSVPGGWVLVPINPTEIMVVSGFESTPDQNFTPHQEWELYEAMTGCQQAAYRAEKCWEAMLAAVPTTPAEGSQQ